MSPLNEDQQMLGSWHTHGGHLSGIMCIGEKPEKVLEFDAPGKPREICLNFAIFLEFKESFCEQVDPLVHREFVSWKQGPSMNKSDPFIARIYSEDIDLCLDFSNKDLSNSVRAAIEAGNIFIEAVDKAKTIFPKYVPLADSLIALDSRGCLESRMCKCALVTDSWLKVGFAAGHFRSDCPKLKGKKQQKNSTRKANVAEASDDEFSLTVSTSVACCDGSVWLLDSGATEHMIIAVCEFLNYLRYIERGLVKSSEGLQMLANEDPDVEHSARMHRTVMEGLTCQQEIYKEKKHADKQPTIGAFFQPVAAMVTHEGDKIMSVHDVYWEMVRLRKEMVLARLGLALSTA
uniref:Uncharacterized protein n=1 Tax=Timema monikensis TaxID=170555 RepID=A0A7R9HNX5_9NEOP|nr:unnamed protein product [Timema monikensis]